MVDTEVEKLFRNEIFDKKKQSNGNRYRSGNSVRKSARKVLFNFETMSRKEKREYTKAGKVETFNMYETIIPKDEFYLKDKDVQKAMMTRWREIYPNTKIMEDMGITGNNTFYGLLKELDVPQKQRGGHVRRNNSQPKFIPTPATERKIEVVNGLNLVYNGVYDSEQINKILTKLQLLVDGEECNYNISINISEVDE